MWMAADPSQLYAIVFVDRDAPSAQSPTASPIRHGVAVNVTGAQLAAGVSNNATGAWLQSYSGPQPPVGSGCAPGPRSPHPSPLSPLRRQGHRIPPPHHQPSRSRHRSQRRCHRYYAILYRQDPAAPPQPQALQSSPSRLNWNFLAWAQANGLTKISVNYFLCVAAIGCSARGRLTKFVFSEKTTSNQISATSNQISCVFWRVSRLARV